jgi:hypothetical protein
VHDSFEASPAGQVREDNRAQSSPVNPARRVKHLSAEGVHDGAVTRLARLLEPATDRIAIDHSSSASREHGGHGGFPNPDATCQADEQHGHTIQRKM